MKKRILTLALALCMLLSILPVTAMAATNNTVEGLLDQLDKTTFGFAYDTQRTPSIPAHAGESFLLSSLKTPLSEPGKHFDSSSGNWTLTKLGSYAGVKNGVCKDSTILSNIVNYVMNTYTDLKEDTVLVHELKKDGSHVAYGVVIAFNREDGYAAFLGDTHNANSGAGYFLSTEGLDTDRSYTVYANMIATDFVQDIQLSKTGTYDFGSVAAGYATRTPLSVTVENIGSVATGDLTIALSGENANAFTLSTQNISSIAVGATSPAFTVTPNNNLTAGEYSAIVTVRGGNIARKSFNITFTVTEALTPAITLSKQSIDFGSMTVGYETAPAAQTVTVTSTGNTATGELTVSVNSTDFTVTPETLSSLNASTSADGTTATFTVQPKANLGVGEHNATVTVSGTGLTAQSFDVSFTVTAAPEAILGFDIDGEISLIGCTNLKEGYTSPWTYVIQLKNYKNVEATITKFSVVGDFFTVTPTRVSTVKANDSVDLTIATTTGLKAGKYNGSITVEGNFPTKTLYVEVTVEANSSSDPIYTPSYNVTAASAEHGTVALSTKNAYAGSAVTVTVTPDAGYALSSLTAVTRSGASVALTDLGSGRYRFTMPAADVTVTASFAASETSARFVDVPAGSTFFDAVEWAAANGITTGTTPTTFSPANACTRGQIVTFLYRACGSPEPKTSSSPFTDVAEDSFCYKAVLWAVEKGITTGTTDTTFSPNQPCTRAQAVTLLYRAVGSPAVSGTSGFPDVPAGAYCDAAVTWAVQNGVTTGTADGRFAPQTTCNRGQIAAFLFRALSAQK